MCYHSKLTACEKWHVKTQNKGWGKLSLQDAPLNSALSTYTCALKLSVSSLFLLGCDSLLYEGIFKLLPVSLFSQLFDLTLLKQRPQPAQIAPICSHCFPGPGVTFTFLEPLGHPEGHSSGTGQGAVSWAGTTSLPQSTWLGISPPHLLPFVSQVDAPCPCLHACVALICVPILMDLG